MHACCVGVVGQTTLQKRQRDVHLLRVQESIKRMCAEIFVGPLRAHAACGMPCHASGIAFVWTAGSVVGCKVSFRRCSSSSIAG
jgi:hypothetical protein